MILSPLHGNGRTRKSHSFVKSSVCVTENRNAIAKIGSSIFLIQTKKSGFRNEYTCVLIRAADFWRFHIPSKKPKADSFPNLDAKRSVIHIVLSSQFFVVVYNGYINCG